MFVVMILALWSTAILAEVEESVPDLIIVPSTAGEVEFPHALHGDDFGIECQECHHETMAQSLSTPHDEYFEDFWIDCAICHRPEATGPSPSRACGDCHHDSPRAMADETLSAKVVIHRSCWGCHEIETGATASEGCTTCHTGPSSMTLPSRAPATP